MKIPDDKLELIARRLINKDIDHKARNTSLHEFQRLYNIITAQIGKEPLVSIVKTINGEVFCQFSDLSPQHFIIEESFPLSTENFNFIKDMIWHGTKSTSNNFLSFLFTEIKEDFTKLLLVLLMSWVITYSTNSQDLYNILFSLLIQSSTVFLSIYLIFTISQSGKIIEDKSLYSLGIVHRYHKDDKNITNLGILSIAMTFISSGIVYLLKEHPIIINLNINLLDARFWKSVFTSLSITILFETFLTVSNYYLDRAMDVMEVDVISEILDEDFKENYKN